MGRVLFIICLTILFFSCSRRSETNKKEIEVNISEEKIHTSKKIDQKGIRIKTTEASRDNINDELKQKHSFKYFNSEYFEIDLKLRPDKKFHAEKDIIELSLDNPNYAKLITIVDTKDDAMIFDSSTDFLNYISEMGYEYVSSTKSRYSTEYVLKKK